MKSKYSILAVTVVLAVGWIILSATKSLEKIKYLSLNEGTVSDTIKSTAEKLSVKENLTFAVKIPDNMYFADEKVPLEVMDVRERLDRELTVNCYWHSSTILMMKRANRYFPIIESILRQNGVPDDLKYIALAESGLQNVVSPAGAAGFWQFMKGTAKENDLIVNSEVDERYHLEKATQAACDYLKQLYDQFGSWTMAAAAYNMGQNGLRNQTERQEQSNYYDLILSDETSRYVFRILAMKAIFSEPADFGFNLTAADLYKPYAYKTFIIDGPVESWPAFCKQNGLTYRELKLLNPWLRDAQLTNSEKREYKVQVMEK